MARGGRGAMPMLLQAVVSSCIACASATARCGRQNSRSRALEFAISQRRQVRVAFATALRADTQRRISYYHVTAEPHSTCRRGCSGFSPRKDGSHHSLWRSSHPSQVLACNGFNSIGLPGLSVSSSYNVHVARDPARGVPGSDIPEHDVHVEDLPRRVKSLDAPDKKKATRMCYYYSQGLCTMMEDPAHLAKFSHDFPALAVKAEDLKKVKTQPFDFFLVLDLEGMVEILEFPVVMINAKSLQVVDRFHRFVKPTKMTPERIADYIRNKYGRWGLDRVWHDTAVPFADVLVSFESWLGQHGLWDAHERSQKLQRAAFVTCGNWDVKTKIPEQCATSELEMPAYFNEWINLKDVYCNFYKFKASGMLKMMKGLKMNMIGTHHVGLDDAHNIARVLQRMLAHGAFIRLTAVRTPGDAKSVKFTFRFRIK